MNPECSAAAVQYGQQQSTSLLDGYSNIPGVVTDTCSASLPHTGMGVLGLLLLAAFFIALGVVLKMAANRLDG